VLDGQAHPRGDAWHGELGDELLVGDECLMGRACADVQHDAVQGRAVAGVVGAAVDPRGLEVLEGDDLGGARRA